VQILQVIYFGMKDGAREEIVGEDLLEVPVQAPILIAIILKSIKGLKTTL
jgi:hypothetical protein